MPPNTNHLVHIIVDSREHALVNVLRQVFDPSVFKTMQMNVGDIRIDIDKHPEWLIERKAALDFYQSVCGQKQRVNGIVERKPPRFRDQRTRMILARKEYPSLKLMYLFEGDLASISYKPGGKITQETLENLQDDLFIKYEMAVKKVPNFNALSHFLLKMYNRCVQYGPSSEIIANITQDDCNPTESKRITIEDNLGLARSEVRHSAVFHLLSGVIGMSRPKAKLMEQNFATVKELFDFYDALQTEEEKLLAFSRYRVETQEKHFGPELSKSIYRYLFNLKDPEAEAEVRREARKFSARKDDIQEVVPPFVFESAIPRHIVLDSDPAPAAANPFVPPAGAPGKIPVIPVKNRNAPSQPSKIPGLVKIPKMANATTTPSPLVPPRPKLMQANPYDAQQISQSIAAFNKQRVPPQMIGKFTMPNHLTNITKKTQPPKPVYTAPNPSPDPPQVYKPIPTQPAKTPRRLSPSSIYQLYSHSDSDNEGDMSSLKSLSDGDPDHNREFAYQRMHGADFPQTKMDGWLSTADMKRKNHSSDEEDVLYKSAAKRRKRTPATPKNNR